MKKIRFILLCVAMLACTTCITACGNKDDDENETSTSEISSKAKNLYNDAKHKTETIVDDLMK